MLLMATQFNAIVHKKRYTDNLKYKYIYVDDIMSLLVSGRIVNHFATCKIHYDAKSTDVNIHLRRNNSIQSKHS